MKSYINKAPKGQLILSKSGKQLKCYVSNGSNPIYIPKKEFSKAEKLAVKKYYQLQCDEISQQIKMLDRIITSMQKSPSKAQLLISENSIYHDILIEGLKNIFDIHEWEHEKYDTNDKNPENLIHRCVSGHVVRSKSEEIIANNLFMNHIPFRYEYKLTLKDSVVYPDFTILNPKSRKIIYWEHFGMMDDINYRNRTFKKLRTYGNNGIIPTIDLITTYETKQHPIDSEQIQDIIDRYFT